jgi:galactonate dehydratase
MRIETVEGLLAGSPVEGTSFLVRITTDDGLVGIGQSAAWGYPEACASVVETFKRYLIGVDPLRIEHHWQLYRARRFRLDPPRAQRGRYRAVGHQGQVLPAPVWELLGPLPTASGSRDRQPAGTPTNSGGAYVAAEEGFTAVARSFLPIQI